MAEGFMWKIKKGMENFKLIAHRGNLSGRNPQENTIAYICHALSLGFDAEIDLWVDRRGRMSLGHDGATDELVDKEFLLKPGLWVHCKNLNAIQALHYDQTLRKVNFFYHDSDPFVLTSRGYIWHHSSCPPVRVSKKSIKVSLQVEPLTDLEKLCGGVCSDFVKEMKL